MSTNSKHPYIKIINCEKINNSDDYIICVVLNKLPVYFSSSLYNELEIPRNINTIYINLKIIGQVLVYNKTYYVTYSGVCKLEQNRQLISEILEYLYGMNAIMF
jgi:hypothetical protein